MASGSSSSSRRSSSMASTAHLPVAYRQSPMAYTPEELCHCKVKAPRWISWSLANPGRRYYNCSKSLGVDCRFFKWHDDPLDEFVSSLLGDLRDVVNRLKTELRKVKSDNAQLEQSLMEAKGSIADADFYVLDLKAIHIEEIDGLKKEFERSKMKCKFAIFFCILSVMYVAVYKM